MPESKLVGMPHTAFSMQFRGHSTRLTPGVLIARATAPSAALATQVAADGVHGRLESREGGEAGRIVSNFLLSETGDLTDNQLGVLFLPATER